MNETNPDTNFKVIDKRSPETQARKAEMPSEVDAVGGVSDPALFAANQVCRLICPVKKNPQQTDCEECAQIPTPIDFCACLERLWSIGQFFDHFRENELRNACTRRTPEPGASVVRWTRYDGREETLPPIFQKVLLRDADSFAMIPMRTQGRRGDHWFFEDDTQREIEIGDEWVFWPEPPEGMK